MPNPSDEEATRTAAELSASDARRLARREAHATQSYRLFLKRLCELGRLPEDIAEPAAVAALCALQQRLVAGEARDLEAQLPLQLQKLLYRCERRLSDPPVKLGRDELLAMVADDLGMRPEETEPLVRAVFQAVRELISEGEAEQVMRQLPADLRALWGRAC